MTADGPPTERLHLAFQAKTRMRCGHFHAGRDRRPEARTEEAVAYALELVAESEAGGARPPTPVETQPRPQWARAFSQPSTSLRSAAGLQAFTKSACALSWPSEAREEALTAARRVPIDLRDRTLTKA
ncbi:MAG TPA: hypothetical protein VMM35_11280 [Longimicrobiales bacterium]|nr:hypothetical protein [Longimicrobiales bacterium]